MTQFDFFIREKERNDFIEYCIKNTIRIVPDQHFLGDEYPVANTFEDYFKYCNDSPQLFLMSNKYSRFDLEVGRFEKDNTLKSYIKQRYGGPTIDFASPIIGERTDGIVGPGYLGIYPFYYHNGEKIFPDDVLKEMFQLLKSHIKKMSIRVDLVNRIYWVGRETIERAKREEIKLLPISGINILDKIIHL